VLLDGTRLPGTLELTAGRLLFRTPGRALNLEQVDSVRSHAATPPSHALRPRHVELWEGQWLAGDFTALDERQLVLSSPWAGRLTIPRAAVTALTHLPGFVPYFADDFESGLRAWKCTGGAALAGDRHVSGRSSLRLDAPGQAAGYDLAGALLAGRVGVSVYDAAEPGGLPWAVQAEFQGADGGQAVRVVAPAAGRPYQVDVPGLAGEDAVLSRKPGWHFVSVEFTASSLVVAVDDLVLWSNLLRGPGGPLKRVRLAIPPMATAAHGSPVWFDDFRVDRAVEDRPHPAGDLEQDEVWLLSGDQVFGHVLRADPSQVTLEGRFGRRSFAWTDVRGIYFREQPPPPATTDGEHVRVWLRSGVGSEEDCLEGLVTALDGRRLRLRHRVLGELDVERARLVRLRRLFAGRRVEIDNGPHHLGRRVVPALHVPRPEGLTLRRTFRLDAVPARARLAVTVTRLAGRADNRDVAAALERGGLCTEVWVNGRLLDYLNRHGQRASDAPRRLLLPLPAAFLRAGDNELEVRLTPDPETGDYADCGLSGLAVEVPR
jgi:hypothetical protein